LNELRRQGTGVRPAESDTGGLVQENGVIAKGAVVQGDGIEDRLPRFSNGGVLTVEKEQVVLNDLVEHVRTGKPFGQALRLAGGDATIRLGEKRAVQPLQSVPGDLILHFHGTPVAVKMAIVGGAQASGVLLG
jgi:hypothetical protein